MRTLPASSRLEVPCLMAFSTKGCKVKLGTLRSSRASSIAISTSSLSLKRAFSIVR
ncbi:Uncharacterised protein [Vibrio cholerae]|nr:Uncharacterised protein [Vibrio cholerae]